MLSRDKTPYLSLVCSRIYELITYLALFFHLSVCYIWIYIVIYRICQMHDNVDLVAIDYICNSVLICNITLDKSIVWISSNKLIFTCIYTEYTMLFCAVSWM